MRVSSLTAAAVLGASAMLGSLAAPAGATTDNDRARGGGDHVVNGRAHLDGRQEVPGPGDRNGKGRFWFKASKHKLCYSLSVRDIRRPTAAHIHFGPRGEAGPIAVTLKTPPRNGSVRDCIKARNDQNPLNAARVLTFWELQGIRQDTFFFYVNVHNNRFPDGAIRGQLRRTS